jgi:hypothetical protein
LSSRAESSEGKDGVTGNFEVTIVETGKLIHSKKGGQGFADTAGKQQAIVTKYLQHSSQCKKKL